MLRFLLNSQQPAGGIELHHAVALRITHWIGEHGGSGAIAGLQLGHQVVAVKEVVAQHQGRGPFLQEIRPDQEGLGQSIGTGLDRVLDRQAPGRSIPQEPLEGGLIRRRGEDQHLPDPRQHQRGEGIAHHRIVVHRHQLLADGAGEGGQPGAAAARQENASALDGSYHGRNDASMQMIPQESPSAR